MLGANSNTKSIFEKEKKDYSIQLLKAISRKTKKSRINPDILLEVSLNQTSTLNALVSVLLFRDD